MWTPYSWKTIPCTQPYWLTFTPLDRAQRNKYILSTESTDLPVFSMSFAPLSGMIALWPPESMCQGLEYRPPEKTHLPQQPWHCSGSFVSQAASHLLRSQLAVTSQSAGKFYRPWSKHSLCGHQSLFAEMHVLLILGHLTANESGDCVSLFLSLSLVAKLCPTLGNPMACQAPLSLQKGMPFCTDSHNDRHHHMSATKTPPPPLLGHVEQSRLISPKRVFLKLCTPST